MDENLSSKDLLKLAQDSSKGSKKVLMENITDMFLSPEGRLNEHERVLMNDIMMKLLKTVEKTIRKNLSEKLAEADGVSIELVTMLANDHIEVASPVLEKSKILQDEDLIETIRNRTDSHRLSIAIRDFVSEDVSGELIEHGNEDVIEALIKNDNADISKASLDYLVQESRSVDRFQEPLVNRSDLSFEMAHKMYWWVSAALRRQIVADYDIDGSMLDDALEDATKEIISGHNAEDGVMQKAILLCKTMDNQRSLNFDFVITSLRQQKINVAVAAIAQLSGLGVKIVWRIIREKNDEGLTVVSKAIGLEKSQFSTMFLLVLQVNSGPKARSTSILNTMLHLYDKIKPDNARAAVKYWQRDFHFQEAQLLLQDAC
ncbi:MAG: DUF2336 domain-containing protein [Emcibacteraceae bacterium]|nr:DUF2336 domain-containing protein [Emcibacteraceae bacterium]